MSKYNFEYLGEKVRNSTFAEFPFRHIYIEDFFKPSHFEEIIGSAEVASPNCSSDEELIDSLTRRGFSPIVFPGTTTDVEAYLKSRKDSSELDKTGLCEGVGVVLRQKIFKTDIISSLTKYLFGEDFSRVMAEKFDIDLADCSIEGGIQKYLDGYEISPHPDIRSKATTFMVNINPSIESEKLDHHTHYGVLKDEYSYLYEFWENNQSIERCWVPWDWTSTVKQQSKNNSIVIFAPNSRTIHAVKANYDHLVTQRTQLYGNLWYKNPPKLTGANWRSVDLKGQIEDAKKPEQSKVQLTLDDVCHLLIDIKQKNPVIARELKSIL